MNILEMREAKSLMEQERAKKDPFLARQLKRAQGVVAEEQRRMEILDSYGPNGYIPPKSKEPQQQPKKTDEQLIMESILDQF